MQKNCRFQKEVDELKNMRAVCDIVAEQSADVKEGKISADDEKQEPAYILTKQIIDTNISILSSDIIQQQANELDNYLDRNAVNIIVTMMSAISCQAAHQAILFYDEHLKQELDPMFNSLTDAINRSISTSEGLHNVMKVWQKRIGEIENGIKIEEFVKNNNITPE